MPLGAAGIPVRAGASAAAVASAFSTANTNTDQVVARQPLPANSIDQDQHAAGLTAQSWIVEAFGNLDNVVTASPTCAIWLRLGATKLATLTLAPGASALTNQPWWVRFMLTNRGSATLTAVPFLAQGVGVFYVASPVQLKSWTAAQAATNFDTTVSNNLDFGVTWSAANASNVCRVDQALIAVSSHTVLSGS